MTTSRDKTAVAKEEKAERAVFERNLVQDEAFAELEAQVVKLYGSISEGAQVALGAALDKMRKTLTGEAV